MNITSRVVAIFLSLCLIFLIFALVRRRKLKEKYAILWLFSGSIILIFAIFDNILLWTGKILGIALPANTVFFFGIFFLILINLHFSFVISNLGEQVKKLTQKLALLEIELKNIIRNRKS